jgi:osmotically-inducible protein OsmY
MDDRYGHGGFDRRYDDERRSAEERGSEYEGRRYRGEGYYGAYYQPSRSRGDYGRRDDRGFFDRAGDEVRSWFGDEEAERRRRQDEREARQHGARGPSRVNLGRAPGYADYGDDPQWARQWGYVERPYERTPMAEERPWADPYDRGEMWRRGERGWDAGQERSGLSRAERAGHYGGAAEETWRARGPYTGQGPKGYQRSDERIREDICERLTEDSDLDAREIEVLVVSREVTLQGSVSSRSDKRLAEDIVESVSGVGDVHNQLRVSQGTMGSDAPPSPWRHRAA